MPGIRLEIYPSEASPASGQTLVRGVPSPSGIPLDVAFVASEAQIQGIYGYIKLIKAGATTTSVESAVTALSP